ncbi:MAG: Crp/Fnr family transcriptional regulator [Gammaproteobacteria bacterium]|jgi:CRP-like cAMP-binding protein|nr:Crp/Fnr family transcriptional regulator [Gammaproteobacteria bacterium]
MPMRKARQIVSEVGWLSRQPEAFRTLILNACDLQTRSIGENLYSLGDPPGGLHGLVDGSLDVLTTAGGFSPFLGFIARPGWWAGDVAATTKDARRAEVRARTEAVLLYLPANRLERIGEEDPTFWRRLGALNAEHLDNALMFAATAVQRDVRVKVIATLLRLASYDADTDADLKINCTQAEIAEMTGLGRNTVGETLKKLQDESLVSQQYGRIGFNPVRLRAILSGIGTAVE